MDETHRYRLDDLRRHAAAVGAAAGLARDRAAALAGHLLWYDAACAAHLGIRLLPEWLDRIERGEVDPHAEARIGHEHPATALLDGRNGLPPLILSHAARVAGEKARELGVGFVRVGNIQPVASAAEIAAELAVGPTVAVVLGPRPSWTLALPSSEGLPAVFDTGLNADGADESVSRPSWVDAIAPWAFALVPDGDWLILALTVTTLEPLATFHDRVGASLKSSDAIGALRPDAWSVHRRKAREHGVPVDADTRAALRRHAERLGVTPLG